MKKMSSEEEEAGGEIMEGGHQQSPANCYRVQAGIQFQGLTSTSSKLSNSTELASKPSTDTS